MSAARPASQQTFTAVETRATTLLELVCVLGEIATDDEEVVATVLHLLESGRVRLTGNFRDALPDDLR